MAYSQVPIAGDASSMLMLGWMGDMNTYLPDVNYPDMPEYDFSMDGMFDPMGSPNSWQSGSMDSYSSGYTTPQMSRQPSAQYQQQYYAQQRQAQPQPAPAYTYAPKHQHDQCSHHEFEDPTFDSAIFDDIDWSGQSGEATTPEDDNDLRCWDHGCNGRRFTTRSNLCRHKRENSAARPKYYCPRCGAVFSRAASRDVHLEKMSCNRIRRYSNGRERPPRRKQSSRRSQ